MQLFTNKYLIHGIIIFTLLISYMRASSQEKSVIGVRLMPTISAVKMKTTTGNVVAGQTVLGFGFGGLIGHSFTENFGAQVEVIYNSFSQRYKEQNVDHLVNLRYINIPFLLSINTGRYSPVNFNIVAGPQVGISAGTRVYTSGNDSTKALLATKNADFGFAYGAGLDFGLNDKRSVRLTLGFRGVYGLVDISNVNSSNSQNSYYILDNTSLQVYSLYGGLSVLF
jgi:hypothetical protein